MFLFDLTHQGSLSSSILRRTAGVSLQAVLALCALVDVLIPDAPRNVAGVAGLETVTNRATELPLENEPADSDCILGAFTTRTDGDHWILL